MYVAVGTATAEVVVATAVVEVAFLVVVVIFLVVLARAGDAMMDDTEAAKRHTERGTCMFEDKKRF